jgi:hypothetical protein
MTFDNISALEIPQEATELTTSELKQICGGYQVHKHKNKHKKPKTKYKHKKPKKNNDDNNSDDNGN